MFLEKIQACWECSERILLHHKAARIEYEGHPRIVHVRCAKIMQLRSTHRVGHTAGWKPDLGWHDLTDGWPKDLVPGFYTRRFPSRGGVKPWRRECSSLVRTQKEGTVRVRPFTPVVIGEPSTDKQKADKGMPMPSSPKSLEAVNPQLPSIKSPLGLPASSSTPKPTETPPSSSPASAAVSQGSKTTRSRHSSTVPQRIAASQQSGLDFSKWVADNFQFVDDLDGVSVIAGGMRLPFMFESVRDAMNHIYRYYASKGGV